MEKCSDSNMLSRDSIYVKFDPLVTKVSHDAADVHEDIPKARDQRLLLCDLISSCSHDVFTYFSYRKLLGLDTPPHVLERIQPCDVKDCCEVSQFSPDTEAIPTKNKVRVVF